MNALFEELFEARFDEIYRYAASRIGTGPAEDIVAEVFLTAFRRWDRYDPGIASVRTWLFGIATNLIGTHRRAETRALRALARMDHATHVAGHEESVTAKVSAERLRPELARAIARLNQGDRDVLLLVALANFSHEEISQALGIPYGTVASRLNRARKKLRDELGGTNPIHDMEESRA
jgi:RNA polymerase sigma-70 factor (ECF subfamily)